MKTTNSFITHKQNDSSAFVSCGQVVARVVKLNCGDDVCLGYVLDIAFIAKALSELPSGSSVIGFNHLSSQSHARCTLVQCGSSTSGGSWSTCAQIRWTVTAGAGTVGLQWQCRRSDGRGKRAGLRRVLGSVLSAPRSRRQGDDECRGRDAENEPEIVLVTTAENSRANNEGYAMSAGGMEVTVVCDLWGREMAGQ
jgi:hypothetical protein